MSASGEERAEALATRERLREAQKSLTPRLRALVDRAHAIGIERVPDGDLILIEVTTERLRRISEHLAQIDALLGDEPRGATN